MLRLLDPRLYLAGALAVTALAGGAWAKPPPLRSAPFEERVQDQPVAALLQRVTARAGLHALVAPSVTGTVSGAFSGAADEVFNRLLKAFNLQTYFDGATVYIYPAAEVRTEELGANDAERARIQAAVQGQALTDPSNRLELSGGRLLAMGGARFLQQVEAIARDVARPETQAFSADILAFRDPAPAAARLAVDPVEYRVYYLRYGYAADVKLSSGGELVTIPGVASVLRALITGEQAGVEPDRQLEPAALKPINGGGLAANGRPRGGSPNLLETLNSLKPSEPETIVAPTRPPRGEVRVEAEPRLNAVIVRDTASRLDAYEALVKALDVEPQIVEIEATIIDVDLDRAHTLGINLSYVSDKGSQVGITPGRDILSANDPGLSISAVIRDGGAFIAELHALERVGSARIVSKPLIVTLSDAEALFQNSETFFVPVSGSLSSDLYNVAAGTTLRVTPHATRDGGQNRIRLLVSIEDGSLAKQQVSNIPVVQRAALTTQALILDGQSLLLGGMVSEGSADATAAVPWAADLPLVGHLFKSSRKTSTHTQRLFLITPRLTAVGASPARPDPTALPEVVAAPREGGAMP